MEMLGVKNGDVVEMLVTTSPFHFYSGFLL